jgi:cytochrome c peroxidase
MKLGVINPWPNQADQGKFALTKSESDRMVFKVPSLRNVSSTGPYFHDGSVDTLEYAVNRMAYHQLGKDLSEEKMLSIANWLRTTRSADRAR